MHSYKKNSKKSYTEKKYMHIPSGYSLFTKFLFDSTKNKLDYYTGKDCMKRFCKDLKKHSTKNNEKKKIIPLIYEENKSYEQQKVCYICKKEFITDENDKNAFKLYHKVRDHCHHTGKYRGAEHNICNLRYKTPKRIPVLFHNCSTYDYHFIIHKLAKEFGGQYEC